MSKYLFIFDTETTGLPSRRNIPPDIFNEYNNCRIVQIAWALYKPDGTLVNEESYIIRPDGFTIPKESMQVHKITNRMALQEGVSIGTVIEKLSYIFANYDICSLIAHNISFDDTIVLSEMYRYLDLLLINEICNYEDVFNLIEIWKSKTKQCTMQMGTEPSKPYIKLVNLYTKLFGTIPTDTLHRADADVRVCADVYFKLTL